MPERATVFDPGVDYAAMMAHWELPRDLLGGTIAMRQAGTRWLPKEPKEDPRDYQIRLDRSVLFNGFRSAIRRAAARPFARSVAIQGVERLSFDGEYFAADVDLAGSSLTQFARALYEDAAAFGMTHFIVEFDEQTRMPYWRHVKALDLIGTRFAEDGRTIRDIRISGTKVDYTPDGWDEIEKETIRRYFLGDDGAVYTELYIGEVKGGRRESVQDGEAVRLSDARTRPITSIPIVTCYFNRTGLMMAEPPFEDLAFVNLRHWQSSSDQANILRYARVPRLAATGINLGDEDDEGTEIPERVTVSQMLISDRADAKFYYVEPQGAAIVAGREDLRDLQDQMTQLGSQPNSRKAGVQTATGQWIDEQATEGTMAAWSRAIEAALTTGLWWCEQWLGVEMSGEVFANVFDDRNLNPGRETKAKTILEALKSGLIRRETAIEELKLAGVLSEGIDPQLEAELAKQEHDSPFAGAMASDFDDDGGDDSDDPAAAADDGIDVSEEMR